MTGVPSGATEIAKGAGYVNGSGNPFVIQVANASAGGQFSVVGDNTESSWAQVWVYVVLDGDTSSVQEAVPLAFPPSLYDTKSFPVSFTNLSEGTHYIQFFATTSIAGMNIVTGYLTGFSRNA